MTYLITAQLLTINGTIIKTFKVDSYSIGEGVVIFRDTKDGKNLMKVISIQNCQVEEIE